MLKVHSFKFDSLASGVCNPRTGFWKCSRHEDEVTCMNCRKGLIKKGYVKDLDFWLTPAEKSARIAAKEYDESGGML